MSEETFFVVVLFVAALIVLLQLMATIAWWRRGSKYARLETARREQMTRGKLATLSKPLSRSQDTKFIDWASEPDFDLDAPPVHEKPK